jgi:hypothetical protein
MFIFLINEFFVNKKFNYIIVGINQFFRIDPAPTHRIPAVTKGVFCFVGFRV